MTLVSQKLPPFFLFFVLPFNFFFFWETVSIGDIVLVICITEPSFYASLSLSVHFS